MRVRHKTGLRILIVLAVLSMGGSCAAPPRTISVESLLGEMIDLDNLALVPEPFFKQAQASSYSRKSREGGEAWFDNLDRGQYVRVETVEGRRENVLAELKGPGTITRFWSANPRLTETARFYFDGETAARLVLPFADLFRGLGEPFGPDFSYVSGTGGNLYFPLPYAESLKITIEEKDRPLNLYYEIGFRAYESGARVESFTPSQADRWRPLQARIARSLARPEPTAEGRGAEWISRRVDIPPGRATAVVSIEGEKAVADWSARVLGTNERGPWTDPRRAHNALRSLVLEVDFDGERSIETPLGDFFGSGPGVNPYESLFFTVDGTGRMTSRLLMPFRKKMELRLTNRGTVPYAAEFLFRAEPRRFTGRGLHLRAQWHSLSRWTWPPFDTNILETTGEGKVVGTVYEIANDGLIWWGEGDQKISIDGEAFPSTFGTGTEDDYGYAYGNNRPFIRPYHAQTRVDGPASGGHISLNRWYVLDALPYRSSIRFDQEIWHWMPCRPTWNQVVYWYARPGTPGPAAVDPATLAPVDLGIRANMLAPLEGEDLRFEARGGRAGKERLANCSGAEHLVWRDARPGDRLVVHFTVLRAGKDSVELNLCASPDYGRQELAVNGKKADIGGAEGPAAVDGFSATLGWIRPQLGVFDLREGDNTLEVRALAKNPQAKPGNLFGLDYIFLIAR
jgi:hypothetical protein